MTTPDTEVKPTDMTAGPWIVHYGEAVKIKDANGYTVASLSQIHLHGRRSKNEVEKTARFIVAACNAYEPMREALTAGLSQLKACREQLELYEQDASGETYNSPSLNTAIKVIDAALSTLPVNDRHHSGSDSYQADASAPALSEKFNARSEWLPIESAPHGPNLILAFRNDAGKWRRVIGWHAKQFEIEVDADELHSGLEEGPAGEAIYAKSGWYEYLDADEAPCNRIWPSHWMPLPSPPAAELNFSNEAARDGVSLKSDTSSQPASEAGKLSTDEVLK